MQKQKLLETYGCAYRQWTCLVILNHILQGDERNDLILIRIRIFFDGY